MKNPLTLRVESLLGSVFILIFSSFLLGLFFIVRENVNNDIEALSANSGYVRTFSNRERALIGKWLEKNKAEISGDGNKIKSLLEKYPERPWLEVRD